MKIYGQEYTIAGIPKRAHHAGRRPGNTRMHEIAKVLPGGSASSIAVLSAVNIADDYFSAMKSFMI